MKRIVWACTAALLLAALTGCSCSVSGDAPDASGQSSKMENTVFCRIADGAENGELLLAALNGGSEIYRLTVGDMPVTVDGKAAEARALSDGMEVTVTYTGGVQESYPIDLGDVSALDASTPVGGSYYDLCGFYLKVLEDLWNADPGLNSGIKYVGVDLSQAPGNLTDSEKAAIAWRFGELHSCTPLLGTYDELAEQGYIDRDRLYWEDGILFSISAADAAGEIFSLPVLKFDAQKWRSGDGADFFNDCTAVWPEFGTWTGYSVGSRAIS